MDEAKASAQYDRELHLYEALTEGVAWTLRQLLRREGITATVESRTKSRESLLKKASSPKYPDITQITDVSGVRVIAQSIANVGRIEGIVRHAFEVDEANSVNKRATLGADRFGYDSRHFVVRVTGGRAQHSAEWTNLIGMQAEVQVRTAMQHAWASVEHTLAYKNPEEIPQEIKRRMARIAASLEGADEDLQRCIDEAAQIRTRM